jgi:redox-regulated HSP33 family molecular chaperone
VAQLRAENSRNTRDVENIQRRQQLLDEVRPVLGCACGAAVVLATVMAAPLPARQLCCWWPHGR